MTREQLIYLLYMVVAILLPIVPAYLLYRNLPSKTSVKGPFKGLTVQLKGAFAGYFLLVLIMQSFILIRPKPQDFETYRVEGLVKDVPQETVDDLVNRIAVRPDGRVSLPNGHFCVEVHVRRDSTTRELILPSLIVQRDGYESATVALDASTPDYAIERDRGLIRIKTPISLRKKDERLPYEAVELAHQP
jgi:hypothetical protein